MDKKKLRVSALTVLNNELPDVKVFFEDKGTLYTFNGVYDGCRFEMLSETYEKEHKKLILFMIWSAYYHNHYLGTKKRHRKPMPFQRKNYYFFIKDTL